MPQETTVHSITFTLDNNGIEALALLRHGKQSAKAGYLVYLHQNTKEKPCPDRVLPGEEIGGITLKTEADPVRIETTTNNRNNQWILVHVPTLDCARYHIKTKTGSVDCTPTEAGIWKCELLSSKGKSFPAIFQKISPYILKII